MDRMSDSLLNLFYPETCFACGSPIARFRDCGICADCRTRAAELRILPPVCPSCGIPMPNFDPGGESLCGGCILNPPVFSGARSYGYYSGTLGRLIQGLKFHNRRNLVGFLAPLLADAFNDLGDRDAFNLVVPVPLHPKRRRERGYNQSGLLARCLARRIGIPFHGRALLRIRPTRPQIGLTDAERLENVKNAFHCRDRNRIRDRRILLVDDVMTTGATASSASRALLEGGALRVSVLTLARTVFE
jgi:ComF family protein